MADGNDLASGIGTGLTVWATTGNPFAGIGAGLASFFGSSSQSKAEQEFLEQQQALAALKGERQKEAARIQLEANELRRQRDLDINETNRAKFARQVVLQGMLQENVEGQLAGFRGSSVASSGSTTRSSQAVSLLDRNLLDEMLNDELFELNQLKIETIAGLRDDEFIEAEEEEEIIPTAPVTNDDRPQSLSDFESDVQEDFAEDFIDFVDFEVVIEDAILEYDFNIIPDDDDDTTPSKASTEEEIKDHLSTTTNEQHTGPR
jgi:hypothetical protein